ncbi:hypothetical protein SAMN05216420_1162 [Nitrosospira sp. Nl5]|nr:hypothetical protein SAMN05216420_1162 [Nitrosospira sp. Nl5]
MFRKKQEICQQPVLLEEGVRIQHPKLHFSPDLVIPSLLKLARQSLLAFQ